MPLDRFGVRIRAGRSYPQSYCRTCTVAASTAWQKAHPDRYRELDKRTKARHPEKKRARAVARRAILAGRLTRQPCGQCGHPDSEAHHPDYSKPLEVVWLCHRHHGEAHRRPALRRVG